MNRSRARDCLLVLLWFGAASAVVGGILGVVFNGAGLPLEHLQGTPFGSFVLPGLILGVVVGGTQMMAAVTAHNRHPTWSVFGAVAGFGMLVWIFAELAMLGVFSWLQVVYFVLGLSEIGLILIILDASTRSSLRQRL